MKRRDFIRHLEKNECEFVREGSEHSIYRNPKTGFSLAVPRHRELARGTVRKICDRLEIPRPAGI